MILTALPRTAWLLTACLLCLAPAWADMQILGYAAARHDRFYTGTAPVADNALRSAPGSNWTGVGQSGLTWATMVSPTFFLSANHWHPGGGSTVSFYDNAGNGHSYQIEGGQQIAGSDLWLGWLVDPIPLEDNIANYPVYSDLGSGFIGYQAWSFGQDAPQGVGAQRIGRNLIDGVGTERDLFLPPPGHTDADLDASEQFLVFNYDPAKPGLPPDLSTIGGDEARLAQYDSGGPTFARIDGRFYLAGINYFIYPLPNRRDPSQLGYAGSGVTRVSAYIAAIDAAMAAQGSGERLTVVPEPSMVVLLTAAGVCLAAWRPRRRATRSAA